MHAAISAIVRRAIVSEYLIAVLGLFCFATIVAVRPEFADASNLRDLLANVLPLFIIVMGQTIVLIVGGIDLAVPALIAAASVIGATVFTQTEIGSDRAGLLLAPLGMIAFGVACGTVHGALISLAGCPPFLVTLSSGLLLSGLAVWHTQARPIIGLPEQFLALGHNHSAEVPAALWLAGILAISAHILLHRTKLGRWLYAVGHNADATRYSAVPVRQVVLFAYVCSGFSCAVAALLYMSRLEAGSASLVPRELLLDCLGAAVIGGASLTGGTGTVRGAILGSLFITLLGNGLVVLELDYWHVITAKGTVILLVALLEVFRRQMLTFGERNVPLAAVLEGSAV